MSDYKKKRPPVEPTWWSERAELFRNMGIGIIVLILLLTGVVGFVLSIISFLNAQSPLTQDTYMLTGGGPLSATPLSHILQGAIPMAMTLPNDLSPFVGKTYNVDCITAGIVNTITILSGPVASSWDGTHKIATCNTGGFTFKVSSASQVRVIQSINVVFS